MDQEAKVLSPTKKPPLPGSIDVSSPKPPMSYAEKFRKGNINLFDPNPAPGPATRPSTAPPRQNQQVFDLKVLGSDAEKYDSSFVNIPMRKPKPTIPREYAGASNAYPRWGGKPTPVKGPGLIQEDGKEFTERDYLRANATKRRTCPTSHANQSLHARDILGQNSFVGVEEEDNAHTGRRVYPMAELIFRKGSHNTLEGEDEEWKKARGYGQPGKQYQVNSAHRTMGAAPEVPIEQIDPDFKQRAIRTGRAFAEKPENDLTLKYRYSNGISFQKYEFDPTRRIESEQHKEAISGARAKEQFFNNHETYQMFRAKMNATSSIFTEPLYDKKPTQQA